MAFKRIDIRMMVRRVLRSDAFPKEDIDDAINRVIAQINIMGRFKFHETSASFALVADTWRYGITGVAGFEMIAEEILVYDVPVSPKPATTPKPQILLKIPSMIDAMNEGYFLASGDKPLRYLLWQEEVWLDPIPNATAAAITINMIYFRDLPSLAHDMDVIPTRFPARYVRNVIVMGAALEIEPNLEVNSSTGVSRASNIYQRSIRNMKEQELWESLIAPNLIRDARWANANKWGSVSTVI